MTTGRRHHPPLRVLLFSALPDRDPASGDISYSLALLEEPPPGISYTTYGEALDDGSVRIRGRRPGRHSSLVDVLIFVLRACEIALRKAGLAYREPTWFISIEPDAYDLVHQHVFSVRQVGPKTPVFTSSGYPLAEPYKHADSWGRGRTAAASTFDWAWAAALRVANPNQWTPNWVVMSGYSNAYARWLERRSLSKRRVLTISTGLEDAPAAAASGSKEHLLFVGRDFHRKGADIAIAAFEVLRSSSDDVSLTVVSDVDDSVRSDDRLRVLSDIDRSSITSEHLPSAGVLVAPTRADCGATYAVLEALRSGTPVVTSTYPWLDERLVAPGVRRTGADAHAVAQAIEEVWADYDASCRAARRLWETEFSMSALGRQLRAAYDEAVHQFDRRGPARVAPT